MTKVRMITLTLVLVTVIFLIGCTQKNQIQGPGSEGSLEGQEATNSVTVSGSQEAGNVIVTISANEVSDVTGIQLTLGYNPQVLEYESVTEGSFLNQAGKVQTMSFNTLDTSKPGTIKDIVYVSMVRPGTSGSGVLATVQFKVLQEGQAGLTLEKALLADSQGKAIPVDMKSYDLVTT